MTNFLTVTDAYRDDPGDDSETLLEMAADLPQIMAEFVSTLEKEKVNPVKELDSYRFTDKSKVYFSTYPDKVAEYFDLNHLTPLAISVTFAKERAIPELTEKPTQISLHEVTIEITCDREGTTEIVEIACVDDKDIEHPFTITFRGTPADSRTYTCSPSQVSRLISSMVLTPNQLADIDDVRRGGHNVSDLNPRSPNVAPLLTSLLEDKSDDFSSSRTYHLPISLEHDDNVTPPFITVKSDKYANGATAYDISTNMHYEDPVMSQQALLRIGLEVCADGSLNSVEVRGTQRQSGGSEFSRQELPPNIVMPALMALIEQATNQLG